MSIPIGIAASRVTTVNQWRGKGVTWLTAIRRHVMQTHDPVFLLFADGRGRLFFSTIDGKRVRQKTWASVRIIYPSP